MYKKLIIFFLFFFSFLNYTYSNNEINIKWIEAWTGSNSFFSSWSIDINWWYNKFTIDNKNNFINKVQEYIPWWNFHFTSNTWWLFQYTINIDDLWLDELTWDIRFYEEWNWEISINDWNAIPMTPVLNWEYAESLSNNFINNNIEVTLYCTSITCNSNTYSTVLIEKNTVWTLTIKDKYWRSLTKKYRVWKINKDKPTGGIVYLYDKSKWSNWNKTVELRWKATQFWNEWFNQDWLIWESQPSFTCNDEWWCSWNLSIEDSAWNKLILDYNIDKIDKTLPEIEFFRYAKIVNWKQKIWVKCTDEWWSWCKDDDEKIYYLPRWTHIKCVEDNAWNKKCWKVVATSDKNDYSDTNMWWKKWTRKLWLACQDDMSWCVENKVEKIVYDNGVYKLSVKDNAWITTTKQFLIERLDNTAPENIEINPIFNPFKASDQNKIKIIWTDNQSWLDFIKYKWNESCKDWVNIIWNEISSWDFINYTVAWEHILYVCFVDKVWNISEITESITIYPWDLNKDKSSISIVNKWDKFWNNDDFYIYTVTLKDKYSNNIYNKKVSVNYRYDNINDTIKLDSTDNDSSNAIYLVNNNITSDNEWKINVLLKSYAPWNFNWKFYISMKKWWNNYINTDSNQNITFSLGQNSFKKPLKIWEFKTISNEAPQIWKDLEYKIKLDNIWDVSFTNGTTYLNQDVIQNKINWHYWNKFDLINKNLWWSLNISELSFSWNIDATNNLLKSPELRIESLKISYKIGWKIVKYYLDSFDYNWVSWCDVETLWVKIIGSLQWDWKADQTWQKSNISDLSKWSLRWEIRKKAYSLIRNRISSDRNINNVVFIEWDKLYSEVKNNLEENDTIIIKNWNFIIDENINKNIWIIVLKDNYDMNSDYNKEWNIYINNDVTYIKAIIYADWALRSADEEGIVYNDTYLWQKLELFGSIFTRNTIWWAVRWDTSFTLPWWQKINSFDLAQIYDLNYIRKVDVLCDWSDWDWYSFVIKFNPKNQINPPKWFSK